MLLIALLNFAVSSCGINHEQAYIKKSLWSYEGNLACGHQQITQVLSVVLGGSPRPPQG